MLLNEATMADANVPPGTCCRLLALHKPVPENTGTTKSAQKRRVKCEPRDNGPELLQHLDGQVLPFTVISSETTRM